MIHSIDQSREAFVLPKTIKDPSQLSKSGWSVYKKSNLAADNHGCPNHPKSQPRELERM